MKAISRVASLALLILGVAGLACASVPEIDPGTGMNGLALLAGAAIVVRAGFKK